MDSTITHSLDGTGQTRYGGETVVKGSIEGIDSTITHFLDGP